MKRYFIYLLPLLFISCSKFQNVPEPYKSELVSLEKEHKDNLLHYMLNHPDMSIEKIGFVIAEQIGLNTKDNKGNTPLHIAVKQERVEIIELLLNAKVDLNSQNEDDLTPLFVAVIQDRPDIVKMLLEKKANPDVKNSDITPLFHTLQQGNSQKQIAEILIEYGANLEENFPLYYAIENNLEDLAEKIIYAGAKLNRAKDDTFPIHLATEKNSFRTVKALLSKGANPDAENGEKETALHIALNNEQFEIGRELISAMKNLNAKDKRGEAPLHIASKKGQDSIVKFLIGKGVNKNIEDKNENSPLHLALIHQNRETANLLLDLEVKIDEKNDNGDYPIHIASKKGYLSVIEKIVNREKRDLNLQDSNSNTPLILAIRNGFPKVSELLIDNGADIREKDANDRMAINHAVLRQYGNIVRKLLEVEERLEEGQIRSFEVNEQDDVGDKIPMHYAAETGNLDIFKTLFEASGKVAKPDEEGWNALHYASKDGHRNIVNYILKYGKESIKEKWEKEDEIDKRDDDRRTPLFLASQFGSLEVAQALILNGADIDVEDRNENTVLDVAGNSKMADFIRVQHHMRLGDAEGIINFVRNGGNQNVQDRNGDTLLIHLIRLRDFEKVVEILELGADKYIENHQGHNAITVAIQTDHRFYAHLTGGNSINPDDSGPIISARCYSKRERERILTAQNSDEVFSDGRRFFTNKCILQGEIRDESRITLATVNGVTIPLYGDGSFEFELELVNGNNLVEIYARDRFGNPTNYPLNLVAEIPDVLPDIQNWYKRQKAIVVGINRYRNRAIEPLENAENDARAVAKLFRDLGYDVTLLLGSDATEERILDEMEKAEVDIDTSESNSFIFYYAGHGQGITIEKTGARHGYILPYNSTVSLSNPTYSSYAKSNAISIDRLQNTASEMPQNHVALLLDSCFSGLATQLRGNERKIVRGNEHYKNLLNKKSSFVLTAGDDEPVSDGSDNHSPFAQGVINALEDRMADEDGDGFATFTDLALYVKNYVQRVTKYEQKPQIINFGKEEGETIIKLK